MIQRSYGRVAASTGLCAAVTFLSILALEIVAGALYLRLVSNSFEYVIPAISLALPLAVWISAAVGAAVASLVGLRTPLILVGILLGVVLFSLCLGGGDIFFNAAGSVCRDMLPNPLLAQAAMWAALAVWAGMGIVTARGFRFSESRRSQVVGGIVGILAVGCAVLALTYLPVARAEMRLVTHLSERIFSLSSRKVPVGRKQQGIWKARDALRDGSSREVG